MSSRRKSNASDDSDEERKPKEEDRSSDDDNKKQSKLRSRSKSTRKNLSSKKDTEGESPSVDIRQESESENREKQKGASDSEAEEVSKKKERRKKKKGSVNKKSSDTEEGTVQSNQTEDEGEKKPKPVKSPRKLNPFSSSKKSDKDETTKKTDDAEDETKSLQEEDSEKDKRRKKKKREKKKDDGNAEQEKRSKEEDEDEDEEPQHGEEDQGVLKLPPFRRPIRANVNTKPLAKVMSDDQPEVHIIGEIVSGFGFPPGGLSCKWFIDHGKSWSVVGGAQLGQTHVDHPLEDEEAVWSHPIDIHFTSIAIQGWPRIQVEVWRVDDLGRAEVCGYGFTHLPTTPGPAQLEIETWRPLGTAKEELESAYIGGTQQLITDEVVYNRSWADRCLIRTVGTGKIFVEVDMVLRHFGAHYFEH